jgi:protoheme ferro-lyase
VITIKQAEELQARLGNKALVRYAMRYGQPNIPIVLDEMVAKGCDAVELFFNRLSYSLAYEIWLAPRQKHLSRCPQPEMDVHYCQLMQAGPPRASL